MSSDVAVIDLLLLGFNDDEERFEKQEKSPRVIVFSGDRNVFAGEI